MLLNIPDDRIDPETPLTDEEIKALAACEDRYDYQDIKGMIKQRRGEFFPPDWYDVTTKMGVRVKCKMCGI